MPALHVVNVFTALDGSSRRVHVIEYQPHEDAPVVWGRIVVWVDAERFVPLQQEFFDEDGVMSDFTCIPS